MLSALRKHWQKKSVPAPVYKRMPSMTEPSGVVDIEMWHTRLGPIGLSGRWAFMAEQAGVDPGIVNEYARHCYSEKNQRSEELFTAVMNRFSVEREIPRLWMETLHAKNICEEVINRDVYGTDALHSIGFKPQIIVDIGGHIGTFSLRAHSLWPEARIITLEPRSDYSSDPNNLHVLSYNVQNIRQITVVHKALIGFFGEADNQARIQELAGETFRHWVELGLRGFPLHAHKTAKGGHTAMSVKTLLETQDIHSIDLLKLDCEGGELNILRECKTLGLLPRITMIRGEWHGEIAKTEIPRILEETHRVRLDSLESTSGLMHAALK